MLSSSSYQLHGSIIYVILNLILKPISYKVMILAENKMLPHVSLSHCAISWPQQAVHTEGMLLCGLCSRSHSPTNWPDRNQLTRRSVALSDTVLSKKCVICWNKKKSMRYVGPNVFSKMDSKLCWPWEIHKWGFVPPQKKCILTHIHWTSYFGKDYCAQVQRPCVTI